MGLLPPDIITYNNNGVQNNNLIYYCFFLLQKIKTPNCLAFFVLPLYQKSYETHI